MVYRATVWYQSASALAVDGDTGGKRRIVEREAESDSQFRAIVMDDLMRDVDDDVTFGAVGHPWRKRR